MKLENNFYIFLFLCIFNFTVMLTSRMKVIETFLTWTYIFMQYSGLQNLCAFVVNRLHRVFKYLKTRICEVN
jgi:hypothetical protein